mmetsp:Transcript_20039/g.32881  ORF Transcript_20039/g.32881 Transcript_20039/m.32881 type:complete len:360 (+) Transcript_20039:426-1505(+)
MDAMNKDILGFVGIGFERMAREGRSVDMWFPIRSVRATKLSGKVHFILQFFWGETDPYGAAGPNENDARVSAVSTANSGVWRMPQTAMMAESLQDGPTMVPRTTAALQSAGVYLKKASKCAKGVVQVGGTQDESDMIVEAEEDVAAVLDGRPIAPVTQSVNLIPKRPKSSFSGDPIAAAGFHSPSSSVGPVSPNMFTLDGGLGGMAPVPNRISPPPASLERTMSGHGPMLLPSRAYVDDRLSPQRGGGSHDQQQRFLSPIRTGPVSPFMTAIPQNDSPRALSSSKRPSSGSFSRGRFSPVETMMSPSDDWAGGGSPMRIPTGGKGVMASLVAPWGKSTKKQNDLSSIMLNHQHGITASE